MFAPKQSGTVTEEEEKEGRPEPTPRTGDGDPMCGRNAPTSPGEQPSVPVIPLHCGFSSSSPQLVTDEKEEDDHRGNISQDAHLQPGEEHGS